ncbi:MAG: hypothetical protein IPK15_03165 [Verrucomicrobia bacterium]|nr:hypothetical protein [Verrucomicrobiota bacterium]
MKPFITLLTLTALTFSAVAGQLQPTHVSDNAKWVAHLDVAKLITTELGGYLGRTFMDKKLAKPTRDLEQWGIDFDWRDIEGITVYGTSFSKNPDTEAVVVIKSSFNFTEAIEIVIDRIAEYGGDDRPIQKVQSEPFAIYSAKGEVFGTPFGKELFLLSKSKAELEKARSVLDGKLANITKSKNFPGVGAAEGGFLVAAIADGFQTVANLPPQVRGLKNAESGQINAGEKADKVFVKLSVNTRDNESATQMQQVLQGLLALAALSQEENKDLALLVHGAKVSGTDRTVTVNLEVPSETVIAKVSEKQPKRKKQK